MAVSQHTLRAIRLIIEARGPEAAPQGLVRPHALGERLRQGLRHLGAAAAQRPPRRHLAGLGDRVEACVDPSARVEAPSAPPRAAPAGHDDFDAHGRAALAPARSEKF